MTITPETLIASADEIDNRLGPIPGRFSDRIARELRQAAEDIRQFSAPAQPEKVPVVWASFTERGYVRFWTTDKMRAVAEMVAGTFNVKPYTVDDLMGMVARASAAQPPAAPVEACIRTFDTTGTTLTRIGKVLTITCADDATANRVADQLRTEPHLRSSAVIAEARKQAFAEAMDELDKLRTRAATDFKSPNCQGQRGADRTDAFYDAYHAIRKLSEAAQPQQKVSK